MLRFLPSLILALPLVAGCGASCDRVCDKLLTCGDEGHLNTDRFSHQECEASCQRQADLFVGWEDEDVYREAWSAHRSCIVDAECADIADGVCFDDRFFIITESEG